MAIMIDSAIIEEVRQSKEMGWVKGATSNPSLLAQAGLPAAEVLRQMNDLAITPFCYQLVSKDLAGMQAEAEQAASLFHHELILKIAPTPQGFAFVAKTHFPCAVTAVYSPAQARVASEAGARYVIVYVNRATRLLGDGMALVSGMARVLAGTQTEIIAASLKSADEAAGAVAAGSHHLTVPFEILKAMMNHPLSDQAIQQFDEVGIGLVPLR